MSNPWKKTSAPVVTENLADIMAEQFARGLQVKEDMRFAESISEDHLLSPTEEIPSEVARQIQESNVSEYCDSDSIIAKVLQCQFDKEYDEEIKLVEKKRNGDSKVSISLNNYRNVPSDLLYDSESDEDDFYIIDSKDWDRFDTNQKEFELLPKRGFKIIDGEMKTKHDNVINGRRNACRVMAFPPDFCTGDGAGFDMKLPNTVFNSLKAHSRSNQSRHKMLDRKESQATATLGIDEKSKIILFKFIQGGMLESINGVISTGKESVVLHADSNTSFVDPILPKECAIKVFKTTINEFKTRDKYIESDYRFRDRFSKQNPRKIVHMWAEKEMHNLMRLQKIGINCPSVISLKKHILLMSFIGKDSCAAPKLKNVKLKTDQWQSVYEEIVDAMYKMYNKGHMIHADLSEHNLLWFENKCWIIDVSQSVQPDHPNGLEFLLRDCRNIYNFFEKKCVPQLKSIEELFKHITGFEDININLIEGVRSTYNSLTSRFEIEPDDTRNITYPFEYCWEKTKENKDLSETSDESKKLDQINHTDIGAISESFGNEIPSNQLIESDISKIDITKAVI